MISALNHLDRALLGIAAAWRWSWLDVFFSALTWLGSLWLLLPISVLAGFHVYPKVGRMPAMLLAALPAVVATICYLLKVLTDRERPHLYEVVGTIPAGAAFPSAHSAQAMAVAVAFSMLLPVASPRIIAVLMVLLVLSVGCSKSTCRCTGQAMFWPDG